MMECLIIQEMATAQENTTLRSFTSVIGLIPALHTQRTLSGDT